MDRLETFPTDQISAVSGLFTFQYGQIRNAHYHVILLGMKSIYIPVWIDQKRITNNQSKTELKNLHSSMDRLETRLISRCPPSYDKFTFQYGQIRNLEDTYICNHVVRIYIPVWIDQKLKKKIKKLASIINLHSSMDRLETMLLQLLQISLQRFTFQYGQIRNIIL